MLSWITSYWNTPEPQYKKYGWKKDLPDFRDHYKVFTKFNHSNTVDLRTKCPSVYNQGKLGSCTANSIAGAYEFDMIRQKEQNVFVPSRLFIYYNEREMEGNVDTDSGAQIRDGIKSINTQGIVPEKLWPYDISKFTEKPSDKLYEEAKNHLAVKYSRVVQDIDHIKEALNRGFPICFGFAVYESFETEEVATSGIMPMPKKDEKQLGGHAVLAVGYDENKKVIIVRNSWGEEWGDKGYFYMPYDFINDPDLASDFWIVERVLDADFKGKISIKQ